VNDLIDGLSDKFSDEFIYLVSYKSRVNQSVHHYRWTELFTSS